MTRLISAMTGAIGAVVAMTGAPAWADTAQQFGQADTVWDAQISPDGAHVALGCNAGGVKSICIYDLVGGAKPRVVYPGDELRTEWFYWAGDNYLVTNVATVETLRTVNGLREYDFRRALSYDLETGETAFLMRDVGGYTDLTDLVNVCDREPDEVVMEIGYRLSEDAVTGSLIPTMDSGVRVQTYDVNLKTGKSKRRRDRQKAMLQTVLGPDCQPFVNVLYNDERQTFAIEMADSRERIFERDGVDVWPVTVSGLTLDGDALIVRADFDEYFGLYSLSLSDGAMAPLTYEGVELGNLGVLTDLYTDAVIGFSGTDDLTTHVYIDDDLAALQGMVEDALPGKIARILTFDRTRNLFTIATEAPGEPADYFLFDAAAAELSPLGNRAPLATQAGTGTVVGISYAARDGLEIPGYLTLPAGRTRKDGPFPTVIMPHGGPEARDTASFNWWSQAYAAAGYAVIQPNFRGSFGYGRAFRDAGFGEFGGKMVDDVIDVIAWAEAEGISDPRGVCVAGGSYGGYAALMTALKAPDKVGCVIAVAPVTNIFSHMGRFEPDTATYRYWSRYVGGDTFMSRDKKAEISPMERATEYDMPVLLIHGKDDLVVKLSQSRAFERNWGNGTGLTFVEMDGQDHYLTSTIARETVLRESLSLMARSHPAR